LRAVTRGLQQIAIAAHHDQLAPLVAELPRERRQHVIGFEPGRPKCGDAERVDQLIEPAHLRDQRARSGGTTRLVLGVLLSTEGLGGSIEREREPVRRELAQQLEQEHARAVQRRGRLAAGGAHLGQRVVRPEQERVRIEQQDRRHARLAATHTVPAAPRRTAAQSPGMGGVCAVAIRRISGVSASLARKLRTAGLSLI
jgi:hypothetical protein